MEKNNFYHSPYTFVSRGRGVWERGILVLVLTSDAGDKVLGEACLISSMGIRLFSW